MSDNPEMTDMPLMRRSVSIRLNMLAARAIATSHSMMLSHDGAAVEQHSFGIVFGDHVRQNGSVYSHPEQDGEGVGDGHHEAGAERFDMRFAAAAGFHPRFSRRDQAFHSDIGQDKKAEKQEKGFHERDIQKMNKTEVHEQHKNAVGGHGAEPNEPGMQKTSLESPVHLCGIDGSNRGSQRKSKQEMAYPYVQDSVTPLFKSSLFIL